MPNAGHNLAGSVAPFEILAFYETCMAKKPRPEWTWTLSVEGGNNTLTFTTRVFITPDTLPFAPKPK